VIELLAEALASRSGRIEGSYRSWKGPSLLLSPQSRDKKLF